MHASQKRCTALENSLLEAMSPSHGDVNRSGHTILAVGLQVVFLPAWQRSKPSKKAKRSRLWSLLTRQYLKASISSSNKIGLWDKSIQLGKEPSHPRHWFRTTMDLLQDFSADPLPVGITPKSSIIFVTELVMTGDKALLPEDDDVKDMEFLSKKRTGFSPGGWEDLFPGDEVIVEKAEGAHHFSMMKGDLGKRTASFIDRGTL